MSTKVYIPPRLVAVLKEFPRGEWQKIRVMLHESKDGSRWVSIGRWTRKKAEPDNWWRLSGASVQIEEVDDLVYALLAAKEAK